MAVCSGAGDYDPNRYQRDYMARRRASAQEIGPIPLIVDPIRRRDCLADFQLFCRTYHASEFSKLWADYQKSMATRIQQAVEFGGWCARAVPRGGGKTTLCSVGLEWAALRGSHFYPTIFGASEALGVRLLKGIKTQFLTNELLLADFPHAIYPIWMLGNEARKATGQKYNGQPTFIEWSANRIVLPWIDEEASLANGVVIEAFGITSALRGLKHTRPDGRSVRPDLALVDDPQTRESAKSPSQSQTRLEILTGDIAYLAGPGEKMPVFCPCTVIYEGDLADQILDRDKHPEWQGERTKMVESFPSNLDLWDQYADILRASLREDGDFQAANAFYASNREKMDAGAAVSWEERYREDELSAIQHAMNLKIRDEAAFYAECQNEPIIAQDNLDLLSEDEICNKVTGYSRGIVPDECSAVTAFTDVQDEHLFWMVCAWTPDFTGYIIDYGAWPDQKRNYFTRHDIRKRLSHVYPGDASSFMFAGLTDLGTKLARPYQKASGGELPLARWCIDIGFRATPITAYAVQSAHRNIISLTRGFGVTAKTNPFNEAERARKWRTTHGHWFWADGPGAAKAVRFDTNYWKTRVHLALLRPLNARGSIQLFKAPPQVHRMLADHLRAEKATRVEAKGRIVHEFTEIPGRDNEGLDCLVGCALGASIVGITPDTERVHNNRTVSKSLSDWASAAKGK